MKDITDLIIDNMPLESGDFEINIPEGWLVCSVDITDDRHWAGPNYDSCDGLPSLKGGEVNFDLTVETWDDEGNELDYDFWVNDELIYKYLNDEF